MLWKWSFDTWAWTQTFSIGGTNVVHNYFSHEHSFKAIIFVYWMRIELSTKQICLCCWALRYIISILKLVCVRYKPNSWSSLQSPTSRLPCSPPFYSRYPISFIYLMRRENLFNLRWLLHGPSENSKQFIGDRDEKKWGKKRKASHLLVSVNSVRTPENIRTKLNWHVGILRDNTFDNET